ncbi:MAG: hypothetical protein KME49_02965 [Brasilonema octagenarum HA4186-MV1]|jgi:hypothetical protein|nr:hypothetical protein [Brasilonema octagenarum HA4186-MV1]
MILSVHRQENSLCSSWVTGVFRIRWALLTLRVSPAETLRERSSFSQRETQSCEQRGEPPQRTAHQHLKRPSYKLLGAMPNALRVRQSPRSGERQVLQRGGSFSGEASPENVPWEPQREIPTEGNPLRSCHNAGNPRKALLSAGLAPQRTGSPPAALVSPDAISQGETQSCEQAGKPGRQTPRSGERQVLQRGGSFSGEASPENVPWEPQRQIPTEGNPLRSCHNAGNPRKALLSAGLAPQRTGSPPAALALQRTGSPTIATFSPGKCHLQLS